MALVVLSVVEQRLDAVRAVLAGMDVIEVAARAGVHRSTVHRWVARYLAEQIGGLADRSHRPALRFSARCGRSWLYWRRNRESWRCRPVIVLAGRWAASHFFSVSWKRSTLPWVWGWLGREWSNRTPSRPSSISSATRPPRGVDR